METPLQKEFIKILNSIDYSRHTRDKFRDFCRFAAYALALPFYPEKASAEIKQVTSSYKHEDIIKFDQMFNIMVQELEAKHLDFLGEIFMLSDMGNANKGQFFTPYHLSLAIAELQLQNIKEDIQEKGFITISEPCCGSGGMIVAVREVLLKNECNPSRDIFVEMKDVDELAFLMSYVQISLYGIPAAVIWGNTITMETYQTLYTPVFFLENWGFRLAMRKMEYLTPRLETPSETGNQPAVPDRQVIDPPVPEPVMAEEPTFYGEQLELTF